MSGWYPFAALLIASFLSVSCRTPAGNLPVYDKVPSFTMTDSEGRPFYSKTTDPKIWIVDFIYTNCPAECPMMTSKMHAVEKKVRDLDDVQLLSISVDPERDTPPVLHAFAQRYGGPTPQWLFLTGSPQTVHLLAYATFHVGDVLGKIEHSTKFMLVDKNKRIRGYYSTFDPEGIPTMLNDLADLRRAQPW